MFTTRPVARASILCQDKSRIGRLARISAQPHTISPGGGLIYSVPGLGDVDLINVGSDFTFTIPAGIVQELGPFPILPVTRDTPKGDWQLSSRMTIPVRETVLSEDINRFTVR